MKIRSGVFVRLVSIVNYHLRGRVGLHEGGRSENKCEAKMEKRESLDGLRILILFVQLSQGAEQVWTKPSNVEL